MLPSARNPKDASDTTARLNDPPTVPLDGPTPFLSTPQPPRAASQDPEAGTIRALARERDYLLRTREIQRADFDAEREAYKRHIEDLKRLRREEATAYRTMAEEHQRELTALRAAIEHVQGAHSALEAESEAWRERAERPLAERVRRTLLGLPERFGVRPQGPFTTVRTGVGVGVGPAEAEARGTVDAPGSAAEPRSNPEPNHAEPLPSMEAAAAPPVVAQASGEAQGSEEDRGSEPGQHFEPAQHSAHAQRSEPAPRAERPAPAPDPARNGSYVGPLVPPPSGAPKNGFPLPHGTSTDGDRVTRTDVLVLGSGLAGSIAALCLVRQGLRVILLDQGTHPRFALGESTTTPSSLWLKVIAERFNAPELDHITSAQGIRRHVAPTSGVKSNFGFLYHDAGAERMSRAWQAVIAQAEHSDEDLGPPPASEMHYFRQDIDAYLWSTALGAGAVGRPGCRIEELTFHADGATARTSAGETIECGFVIDASGYRSVVADTLGLRDAQPRMRTNSRALFTHMAGVRPYEDVDDGPKPLAPWSQGTLHHFFDGGWMWVIPFGNHPGSQNKLCSVGLSFDNERFPRDRSVPPEKAWADFLAQHPSIAKQFKDAVPVRPWTVTDRLQYSSKTCVGARFWLTSHAAGTVDALYSMGNINTFQSLATGIRLVLEAFERDRFDEEHFQPLQRLTDNLLRFQDRIVYGNYQAFRAPELLELWFTLWGLTDGARVREVLKPLVCYARTNRMSDLTSYDERPEEVFTGFGQSTGIIDADEALEILDGYCDIMQELQEGRATVEETVSRLRSAMDSDERFDFHVDDITNGLGRLPWLFEPLRNLGLKTYSTAFLTPEENLTLGVEGSDLPPHKPRARKPWEEERELFVEHTTNLERERNAYREHAANLERELESQVKAYEADRDSWRERALHAESQLSKGLTKRMREALGRRPH